ncbi:MAG: M14 family metallopeptidase [Pseudanabaenaceae cyanobacterium]
MLTVLDHFPLALLTCSPRELWQILPQPTLIHLRGAKAEVLFVSVLLHGNETTGWLAIRQLLRDYGEQTLPRSLSLLIGNVTAARYGKRRLDWQTDYNRIWGNNCAPEAAIAQAVMAEMSQRHLFACIDIHNNTGRNPYYSCVSYLSPPTLALAELFSPIVLYYPPVTAEPLLINAFAPLCPALLLECGQPDQPAGTQAVYQYLHRILHLPARPPQPTTKLQILQSIATIKLPADYTGKIILPPHLDRYNFQTVPANTLIAELAVPFRVENGQGQDLFHHFFHLRDGQIITKTSIFPAMLTLCPQIIRQDCFCYLMTSLTHDFRAES